MPGIKEIRSRIKSVRNTGKITRAMEMISSVKMRKAAESVVALRPYAEIAWRIFHAVSSVRDTRESLALFDVRPVKKILFVVVTSNRGLCGSFNAQILRKLRTEMDRAQKECPSASIEYASLGKKGDARLKFLSGDIVASFPDVITDPSPSVIRSLTKFLFDGFEEHRWDRIVLLYTDYVSVLLQKPCARQILPFLDRDADAHMEEMGNVEHADRRSGAHEKNESSAEYLIEPKPEKVLRALLFRLIETQLLHAILESNASQEAARMVAMKSATDAAKEMTGDLTLLYNQIRQAKVTQEIAELSAGMAAVS